MITKRKKDKEKQYQIPVQAVFVTVANSLKEAQDAIEAQLIASNTIFVKILPGGQALVPQVAVEEETNAQTFKH